MKRKVLSWLLVCALVITMVPGTVFSASNEPAGRSTVKIPYEPGAPLIITPPTPVNLAPYNGVARALNWHGKCTPDGKMKFSFNKNGPYSSSTPVATDAGTYTIWYKAVGTTGETEPQFIEATIPQKKITANDIEIPENIYKEYDGTNHCPLTEITVKKEALAKIDREKTVTITGVSVFDDVNPGAQVAATFTPNSKNASSDSNYSLEPETIKFSGEILQPIEGQNIEKTIYTYQNKEQKIPLSEFNVHGDGQFTSVQVTRDDHQIIKGEPAIVDGTNLAFTLSDQVLSGSNAILTVVFSPADNRLSEKNFTLTINMRQYVAPPIIDYIPEPEIKQPTLPTEPPTSGANIGVDQAHQGEMDKIINEILEKITKVGYNPDLEFPQEVASESQRETVTTIKNIIQAAKNSQIKVEIKTDKIDETNATPAIMDEINSIKASMNHYFEPEGTKLLQLANIDVVAQGVKYGQTTPLGKFRNIHKNLTFTFVIPEDTVDKNLAVIRCHDGVVELIPSTCQGNKIVFETNKFSTYALVEYEETAKPEIPEPINPEPVKPGIPEFVKPGIVQNVKVNTDNGLLKVTFDKLDTATNYKVFVKQFGKDNPWRWFKADNGSALVKQLYKKPIKKNGKYQVKVVAYNQSVKGDGTNIQTVYANRIGTRSAKMLAPKFSSLTFAKTTAKAKTTTAKVIAKKVYKKATPKKLQYKVSYRLKGTKTWKSTGYSAKNIKYIKGLKKGKVYTFAVRYRYQSAVDGKTIVNSNVTYKAARVK